MIDGGSDLTQTEFEEKFLKKYCCTSEGITLRGLRDYFRESAKTQGEETVR